jgi:predicted NBD/HSP70 family sugar kinase
VGGGIVIDGRPLVGAAGCAGEVGHVQVNPMGVRCRCGAIGCWETEIGGPALLRRAGSVENGYQPEAVARLLREAAWGDSVALQAVGEVGRWLGAGLGGLINAFNPQRVVLGGYLSTMWPLVEQIVQAELRVRVMAPALETVEIRPAQLGAEATLQGAAELALTRILDDPTLAAAVEESSA